MKDELAGLFERFPDIDEVEFEALTSFVMAYYLEAYENGNPMDMEGEKLRYLSPRFILVGTKLGCATDYVPSILKENMPIIKEFRKLYKPYDFNYEVKYKNQTTGAQANVFSNPSATPALIEDFLVKGMHRLKWTGKDKQGKPVAREEELKISFLRDVMKAVWQVMLLKGMDPTIISVFFDIVDLEKKMIHRRKQKQKQTKAEIFLRKETLDIYMRRQLWHLGLVVLKMRKAAKAWHIRYEMMKRLDAVERFVFSKAKRSPATTAGVGT